MVMNTDGYCESSNATRSTELFLGFNLIFNYTNMRDIVNKNKVMNGNIGVLE